MNDARVLDADLAAVTAERDRRAAKRAELARVHATTIVQLTIVAPGPRKDRPEIRTAFRYGTAFFDEELSRSAVRVAHRESWNGAAGPCSLWALAAEPVLVKRIALRLEDTYALGRLWDFDVCDADVTPVDRASLGLGPRSCLVCAGAAAVCAGRRLHPREDVAARFEELLSRGIRELEDDGDRR